MKKSFYYFLFFCLVFFGCNNYIQNDEIKQCHSEYVIYIQPYDNFTIEEVNKILPELKKQFNYWLYGGWTFKVLNPISLPKSSKIYNKYKASEILNFQKNNIKNDGITIGITHKDICANVHNVENYGILGLSYTPGSSCIVSDKRLKNKTFIWKIMLHEFIHAYYGGKHCPNDDPSCFMVDAKGKGNFALQNKLCDYCNRRQ